MHKTTRDYLGQAFVLWAATYSSAATRDGLGRVHDGHVVVGEYTVVVMKQVLTANPHGNGLELIARSEDGEEFRYTEGHWYRSDEERTPHVDIVDALKVSDETHRYGSNAYADEMGNPAAPSGTEFCLFHGCYFLPEDGCENCARDRLFQLGEGGEGPMHYVPCPFCEQMRSGSSKEDQHWHLKWAHKAELVARGVELPREQQRIRFSQFSADVAISA